MLSCHLHDFQGQPQYHNHHTSANKKIIHIFFNVEMSSLGHPVK